MNRGPTIRGPGAKPLARTQRGFSLIEMVFALAIGALLVAVAASLARWGSQQSGRGDEQNQLNQRTRLLRGQIRADIEAAGIGSTGVIAVPPTALYARFTEPTRLGRNGMPVVRGENNVTVPTVMANTDIIQVVVSDPTNRAVVTETSGPPNPLQIFLSKERGIFRCPNDLYYVVDHSASNGAGRAHLMRIDVNATAGLPSNLMDAETIQFAIAPGSDVMCARITVYWIDSGGALVRADLNPAPTAPWIPLTGALGHTGTVEMVSPGAVDLQIAYGLSSDAVAMTRASLPAARWAYGAGSPTQIGPANRADWFEVRSVRINLLMRSLRKVQETGFAQLQMPNEDDPTAGKSILQTYGRQLLTTTVVLTNQKYFDYSATAGQSAEPF